MLYFLLHFNPTKSVKKGHLYNNCYVLIFLFAGETVAKPGQEPVTNISREHYAYETPETRSLSITQLDSEEEEVRGSRKNSPSPDRVLIESAHSSKR